MSLLLPPPPPPCAGQALFKGVERGGKGKEEEEEEEGGSGALPPHLSLSASFWGFPQKNAFRGKMCEKGKQLYMWVFKSNGNKSFF